MTRIVSGSANTNAATHFGIWKGCSLDLTERFSALRFLMKLSAKIEMTPLVMQSPCRLMSYENAFQKPKSRESADPTL
ncbi:hypothetical protein EMIT0P4_40195 [Pseudomonas sp. IT-P4]